MISHKGTKATKKVKKRGQIKDCLTVPSLTTFSSWICPRFFAAWRLCGNSLGHADLDGASRRQVCCLRTVQQGFAGKVSTLRRAVFLSALRSRSLESAKPPSAQARRRLPSFPPRAPTSSACVSLSRNSGLRRGDDAAWAALSRGLHPPSLLPRPHFVRALFGALGGSALRGSARCASPWSACNPLCQGRLARPASERSSSAVRAWGYWGGAGCVCVCGASLRVVLRVFACSYEHPSGWCLRIAWRYAPFSGVVSTRAGEYRLLPVCFLHFCSPEYSQIAS